MENKVLTEQELIEARAKFLFESDCFSLHTWELLGTTPSRCAMRKPYIDQATADIEWCKYVGLGFADDTLDLNPKAWRRIE